MFANWPALSGSEFQLNFPLRNFRRVWQVFSGFSHEGMQMEAICQLIWFTVKIFNRYPFLTKILTLPKLPLVKTGDSGIMNHNHSYQAEN
jgi:hypothetical protein